MNRNTFESKADNVTELKNEVELFTYLYKKYQK